MDKGRLEAFSDGVIAVAITLLVLNLKFPNPGKGNLGHYLLDHWPDYVAYVISFVTIGIIWINHHAMVSRLREADHSILILNLLLLMSIVVIPFATNLMASYLRESRGEHLAATAYAGTFLVMAVAFSAMNRQILLGRPQLLLDPASERWRRATWLRATSGVLPYLLATALAPLSSYVTLIICGAIAAFYALPLAAGVAHEEQ